MSLVDQKLKDAVIHLSDEIFEFSPWLTRHPEISGEEEKSCAFIVDFLQEHGYEIESPCGIPHSFKAKRKGIPRDLYPKAAVMCEYDALPGMGHGCGHSVSCGISILAALALQEAYPELPMQIDLVGTPAEETIGGKIIMVKQHVFDEYDLAIMSHLANDNSAQWPLLASNDMLITFYGKPAHASSNPWDGINAYNAAQLFSHGADMLRQHLTPDCQFHGIITECGSVPNIVPDKAILDYYLRCATLSGLIDLREKLENCVKGAAVATGCTYTIEQRWDTYCELFPAREASADIHKIYEELHMPYWPSQPPSGSSDLGNVDTVVPTIGMRCCCSDEFTPFHTPELEKLLYGDRGKKTLIDGTIVMAAYLALLAYQPERLAALQKEHSAYRAQNRRED